MSNSPETDAAEEDYYNPFSAVLKKAQKFEHERSVYRAALYKIDEIFTDGCDTYEDREAMGRIARTTLEQFENEL